MILMALVRRPCCLRLLWGFVPFARMRYHIFRFISFSFLGLYFKKKLEKVKEDEGVDKGWMDKSGQVRERKKESKKNEREREKVRKRKERRCMYLVWCCCLVWFQRCSGDRVYVSWWWTDMETVAATAARIFDSMRAGVQEAKTCLRMMFGGGVCCPCGCECAHGCWWLCLVVRDATHDGVDDDVRDATHDAGEGSCESLPEPRKKN